MKLNRKTKYLGILLIILILPMIFNTFLFIAPSGNANNIKQEESIENNLKTSDAVLSWWNESWNYRVKIEIKAQDKDIKDVPIEKRINFTEKMRKLNDFEEFDWNSTRVIEYIGSTETWIEIPCVVSEYRGASSPYDYDSDSNAVVDIFWIMNGTTIKNNNRTYFMYFDSILGELKPERDYGFAVPGTYGAYGTKNLIYGEYFRLADYSASGYRDEQSHYGTVDNPFDNVYGYPIVDELADYEGKVGRVRDRSGRQAHTGSDQRWNMEYYWDHGSYENFPILKVAIKVDDPTTRTSLYVLTEDDWRVVMFTPDAEYTQGSYFVDHTYGCKIVCDGEWRVYEYDLRRLSGTVYATQIEFYQSSGAPNANDFWFDNMISVKESGALILGNHSYLIPESYVYEPEIKRASLQVNAVDLYGNLIPEVNITMYNRSDIVRTGIADSDGAVVFADIHHQGYNFTVTMSSDIGSFTETINITSKAILIDKVFMTINLTCDVGTNFFNVVDADGLPIDSGWIIVGNSSDNIQNCTIDNMGLATFRWLNVTPYDYNYSVYYRDINYNPKTIRLASGDITTANSLIQIPVDLTTVNFTIRTYGGSNDPVSGAKLIFRVNNSAGASIVNLITDEDGKATLRWLNSTGINGNYSLQIEFYDVLKQFNRTTGGVADTTEINFTISAKNDLEFRFIVDLTQFETELLSLNPTDSIAVVWGSQLRIRYLFNITKAGGATSSLGPAYADSISYQILNGMTVIQSGNMLSETNNVGRHYGDINTEGLDDSLSYSIKISAQKAGFSFPSDSFLTLYLLKNTLKLNQSENDDSLQTTYWLDDVSMSVNPYGNVLESFTIKNDIFIDSGSTDHDFEFSIPSVSNDWNLTQIVFNIDSVTHGAFNDIQLDITDPYSVMHTWDRFDVSNYYFGSPTDPNGRWINLTIDLNKETRSKDYNYDFLIEGAFTGTIEVVAEAYFTRERINVQYSKFNITDELSILAEAEGYAMKNITFDLYNCYNTSTWSLINPNSVNLKIVTNENYSYSLDTHGIGIGKITIDDRKIFPLDNQFLFTIEKSSDIIFDVRITVQYLQEFYLNQYLEIVENSKTETAFSSGDTFQINTGDTGWINQGPVLIFDKISNGTHNFSPSELGMTITIGATPYVVTDTQFQGNYIFSLVGFSIDTILSASIQTNKDVNITLSYSENHLREDVYLTSGIVTYHIREEPDISGTVQYNEELGSYQQTIDTSLVDASEYTIRFTINKEHYSSAIKDLDLNVLHRPTLINNSLSIYQLINLPVSTPKIFYFNYTESISQLGLSNISKMQCEWDKKVNDITVDYGVVYLNNIIDGIYELDFDTMNLEIATYTLVITLGETNYAERIAIIILEVIPRAFKINLAVAQFSGNIISVVSGSPLNFEIEISDDLSGNPITDIEEVYLTFQERRYNFTDNYDGTYTISLTTAQIPDAFFFTEQYSGAITIRRANYTDKVETIFIVVELAEIFDGFPMFYFLMIVGAIIAVVGSLVAYRQIQRARIPTFVKKVREMSKNIKGRKSISDSLLYPSKNEFIVKKLGDKWEVLGLSLDEILGLETKRKKKLPETTDFEGGKM